MIIMCMGGDAIGTNRCVDHKQIDHCTSTTYSQSMWNGDCCDSRWTTNQGIHTDKNPYIYFHIAANIFRLSIFAGAASDHCHAFHNFIYGNSLMSMPLWGRCALTLWTVRRWLARIEQFTIRGMGMCSVLIYYMHILGLKARGVNSLHKHDQTRRIRAGSLSFVLFDWLSYCVLNSYAFCWPPARFQNAHIQTIHTTTNCCFTNCYCLGLNTSNGRRKLGLILIKKSLHLLPENQIRRLYTCMDSIRKH